MRYVCGLCGKKCEDTEFVAELSLDLWNIAKDGKEEVLDGSIISYYRTKLCGFCSKFFAKDFEKLKKIVKEELNPQKSKEKER